jgi:adenylosuccinate lyase
VENYVCRRAGLVPAKVSTQVLQRDRHAEYLAALAITAGSLEKFATEIRHLQRTEVLEAEEGFAAGQKGSSAMPHKRNPVNCERIAGLARVLRGNATAALENISLWHERDITHSSVERIIIPDSTTLLHYMIVQFTEVLRHLQIYPQQMERNLNRTHGLIFSQRLLLALVAKGLSREEAYVLVQRQAHRIWPPSRRTRPSASTSRWMRSTPSAMSGTTWTGPTTSSGGRVSAPLRCSTGSRSPG